MRGGWRKGKERGEEEQREERRVRGGEIRNEQGR